MYNYERDLKETMTAAIELKMAHVATGAFRIAHPRELTSELEDRGAVELAQRGAKLLTLFEALQTR